MTDIYSPPTYKHDPQAIRDYPIDWADWLADIGPGVDIATAAMKLNGTEISTYPFTVDDLTIESFTSTAATGTPRIANYAGESIPETKFAATMHVVLTDGQEDDRTIYIQIKER